MVRVADTWNDLSMDARHNLLYVGIVLSMMMAFMLVFGSGMLAFTTVRERKQRREYRRRAELQAQKAQDMVRPEVIVVNIGAEYATVTASNPNVAGGAAPARETFHGVCGIGGFNLRELRAAVGPAATDSHDSNDSKDVKRDGMLPVTPTMIGSADLKKTDAKKKATQTNQRGPTGAKMPEPGVYSVSLYPKK